MTYSPGLKGIIAAETRLSGVDGEAGELVIAGYPLEEIAERASFEEVVYLLWNGELPDEPILAKFTHKLGECRALSGTTLRVLRDAADKKLSVIDALRLAVATFSSEDDFSDAQTLVAVLPTVVATYWCLLYEKEPVNSDPELSHVANFLYMLSGNIPNDIQTRALTTYLNTVADHGMNASTFTARVIASTRSDFISAVIGAIGALKGPIHGGAPGPVLLMLEEIGEIKNAESVLRAKLDAGQRLMGFGHAIYRVRDPRADVLARTAKAFFEADADLYTLAMHVEQTALDLLNEYKPCRRLQTNVEFYTALLLRGLGFHPDLFTPIFAIGRVVGWTAHCFEQRALDRIFRPESIYCGDKNGQWIPLGER